MMWIRKTNGLYVSEDKIYIIQKTNQNWTLLDKSTLETYCFTTMRSCKHFVEHTVKEEKRL